MNNLTKKYDTFFSNLLKFNIFQQTSKILIEQVFIITIILIFTVFIFSESQNNFDKFLPVLAVYLFGFLRILPSFNKIVMEFQSYISFKLFVNKVNNDFSSQGRLKNLSNEKFLLEIALI